MTIQPGNLFADVADVSVANKGEETFSEILARPGLKIERIISQGQISPPGFWYDQAWNEWVIVLKGTATLQFEHEPAARSLGVGDYWPGLRPTNLWSASHPFADAVRVDTRDVRSGSKPVMLSPS